MFNTLRRRLILSHLMPLLVILPLMGIALVYVLESQVLVPNLTSELTAQAALVTEIAAGQTGLWLDPAQAMTFVARVSPHLTARLMLLDPAGRLLASSDSGDAGRLGQPLDYVDLGTILAGRTIVQADYSHYLHGEVADVSMPVIGTNNQVVGIIRLTHRMAGVYEWFLRLRYLIAGVLATGMLLGTAVGGVLALNLERPLGTVTDAVRQLASGEQLMPLPEKGPEEIRLLSRAFNILVERLHALEQNRRHLLANLVHELGRPLGALHSAIQALTGGADEDVMLRRELLAGMDDEVGRLRRLLDDLVGLREQVTGALEMARQSIALSDWLPRVLATWREAAQVQGVQWRVTLSDDLPVVEIDPDRLGQALGNLVSNAIKYTPSGGTVTVEAGVEDGMAWIQVCDTGPGIPPEEQAHLFTPFYQGQAGHRLPHGMGLGLSIAHDWVTAHGGRLEVQSAPGQGSEFTIRLPLANPGAQSKSPG